MLFVELALIRWLGSNVIYLSYFSNFVLMGSFLGIGLGFLKSSLRADLLQWSPLLLAILIALVLLFPVEVNRTGGQLIFFGTSTSGLPLWAVLPFVFVAVALVMSTIAQPVARVFATFDPLTAYRLDILGSLAGIVAFSALSFLGAPPIVWGLLASAVVLVLCRPWRLVTIAGCCAIVAMLGIESIQPNTTWSPYYKLKVVDITSHARVVFANGVPNQIVRPSAQLLSGHFLNDLPYRRLRSNPLDNVLIVGAGNGVDVAVALREGARHVDAVEIDPGAYAIGWKSNPDRPYQDPRVTIHINDGRAFLERTHDRYDLILFALPDSVALVSGQSSIRLESYLFTANAIRSARAHLRDDGAFAMFNYYRETWLLDRLAHTIDAAFGAPPCIDGIGVNGPVAAALTVGLRPQNVACASTWTPSTQPVPDAVDDNRPFVYLRAPSIPSFYLVALALVLGASFVLVRTIAGPIRQMGSYVDLFFMGAAFLLLETKNVVQFALLFGTTWFVNALVFFGILLTVLAAVEVARYVRPQRTPILYAALFAFLALAWAIPPEQLLLLDVVPRFGAAVSLAFAPIFLANLIFAERFRSAASSTVAFGANLLGAMVGGVLEYTSLFLGYRNLLVVVASLYALSLLWSYRFMDEPSVR
jgi:hypothetical protein